MKTENKTQGEPESEIQKVRRGAYQKINAPDRRIPQQTRQEDIRRDIQTGSGAPTGVPKTQRDVIQIRLVSGSYRLYVYDAPNGTWRYATLT